MKIVYEDTDTMMFLSRVGRFKKTFSYFHWHKNIEFLYVLSDGFKILIDGELIEPKTGDIVFIGEHCVHCFIIDNDNVVMRLGQFPLGSVMGECKEIRPVKPHITAEEIDAADNLRANLNDLFGIMERSGKIKTGKETQFIKSIYSAFYNSLMENFSIESKGKSIKKEKQDFYNIVEFINTHYAENITATEISRRLYMDRKKLSEIFLKYSGMRINLYINRLRISKANELIEKGVAITDAALESGFQSVRSFNDVYKKITGITPSEYNK